MLDSSSHGSCMTTLGKVGGKTAVYQAVHMTRGKHLHVLMPQQHSMDGNCGNQTEAFSHGPSCCYEACSCGRPVCHKRRSDCVQKSKPWTSVRIMHQTPSRQQPQQNCTSSWDIKEYSGQKWKGNFTVQCGPFQLDPFRGWETADRRGQETREAERSSRQAGAADTDNSMQREIAGTG